MPSETPLQRPRMFVAAILLSLTLGSVHAFSVFVHPVETAFAVSRGAAGFSYSLALVFLTLLVLLGYRIYDRFRPWAVAAASVFGAGAGLLLVVAGNSLVFLWLGYGVLFGASNGLGYGFALVLAARACPGRQGLGMGVITALYAVGAAGASALLAAWLARSGFAGTLLRLALVFAVTGVVLATLLAGVRPASSAPPGAPRSQALSAVTALRIYWLAYFSSVLAGLMAIGHAAPILRSTGADPLAASFGAVAIAVGNAAGGFLAGWLSDRTPHHRLLAGLSLLSMLALIGLAFAGSGLLVVIGLGLVGFAYGAVIAVFPPAILARVGEADYARAYGRVFTAWGVAGLLGPWLAGVAQQNAGSYQLALLAAAAIALAGALLSARLPGQAAPATTVDTA